MKKRLTLLLFLFVYIAVSAQNTAVFKGEMTNKEYDVYMKINTIEQNVIVPGQDIFGEIVGYIKGNNDSRCWLITSFEVKDDNNIKLEIINDYGSEDLIAQLSYNPKDASYTLTQEKGSTIKLAKKGKWVKLPKILKFQK